MLLLSINTGDMTRYVEFSRDLLLTLYCKILKLSNQKLILHHLSMELIIVSYQ